MTDDRSSALFATAVTFVVCVSSVLILSFIPFSLPQAEVVTLRLLKLRSNASFEASLNFFASHWVTLLPVCLALPTSVFVYQCSTAPRVLLFLMVRES